MVLLRPRFLDDRTDQRGRHVHAAFNQDAGGFCVDVGHIYTVWTSG
jgi:hypothetical protein